MAITGFAAASRSGWSNLFSLGNLSNLSNLSNFGNFSNLVGVIDRRPRTTACGRSAHLLRH